MSVLAEGHKAPDFKVAADNGKTVALGDYAGEKLILYFYPKDDTPGCTMQACGFRDHLPAFGKLKTAVLGISKDPLIKHERFRGKYDLNFPLGSDEDGKMCEAYGVWIEKSMYGKKYMGIDRSTFLIDEKGEIVKIWRKVKIPGHIEELMKTIRSAS
ncbi:MAG TPA: thioredoxin-dependent thiol peroxidase [Micavibrio sp.]|jgi:peroxiredoxin Q/BCP